jgi:hypothetical protein
MSEQLNAERRRVDKLVSVVGRLWDVVNKGFPGSGRSPFLPLLSLLFIRLLSTTVPR